MSEYAIEFQSYISGKRSSMQQKIILQFQFISSHGIYRTRFMPRILCEFYMNLSFVKF